MSLIDKRVEKLREKLADESLEGMLVTNLTNVWYLSGFSGSAGTCLIFPEKAYFISDGRYETQSKQQVTGMEILIGVEPYPEIIKKEKLISDGMHLAFEAEHVSVSSAKKLEDLFPGCSWEPMTNVIEQIAMVKDKSEIRATRKAVEITDQTFEQIIPEIRPGVTEREIAGKISFTYKMFGADGDAFDCIVAGGPNSALPHARSGDRPLQEGDFVILDFGAFYQGYHADMTRTVVVGEATERHREIYNTVREAQRRGCEAAKDGAPCKEVDSACRNYISESGYGDYFNHGTGHGLGLEIHTNPRFSQLSKDHIYENYLMTIEPGIYIPDWGGVRIEDDILITSNGCEILNQSTKDMLSLS